MDTISGVAQDGRVATVELERELEALERTASGGMRWAWLLVGVGLILVLATMAHGATAYATIARIDAPANINTPNPLALFGDVATNGPRVGNSVETNNRATYTRALEQFALDGTGTSIGLALLVGGLFVRANEARR